MTYSPAHLRRRGGGFVLLAVLALLALVAVLLADMARRSTTQAGRAVEAEVELQRRWGLAGVRLAVLPYAGEVLAAYEEAKGEPAKALQVEIELGRQVFNITVADEQAKVNVNVLHALHEQATAEQHIRRLVPSERAMAVRLEPYDAPQFAVPTITPPKEAEEESSGEGRFGRNGAARERRQGRLAEQDEADGAGEHTNRSGDAEDTGRSSTEGEREENAEDTDAPPPLHDGFPIVFVGWNQVFADPEPVDLFGEKYQPRGAVDHLTCWGDGRLNIRRASPQTLSLLVGRLMDRRALERLIRAAKHSTGVELVDLLNAVQVPEERHEELQTLLAIQSRCHSVTVVATDAWGKHYEFAVDQVIVDEEGSAKPVHVIRRLQW